MQHLLKIHNLSATAAGKTVVRKVNLTVKPGQVHVIMGPNGSGKSSLALTLAGHPDYHVLNGKATLGNHNLLGISPEKRARIGLLISFQNPISIPGVTLGQLIFSSYKNLNKEKVVDIGKFHALLENNVRLLGLKDKILERFVNEGFSGGEKKKAEMLILLCLSPKFAIFDEIDSGLDVDALNLVAKAINILVKSQTGIILITHNQKTLNYINPDFVHILKEGKIVKSGNSDLALEIEKKGYAKI